MRPDATPSHARIEPIAVDRAAAQAIATVRPLLPLETSSADATVSAYVVASLASLEAALARSRLSQPNVPVVLLQACDRPPDEADGSFVAIDPAGMRPEQIGRVVETLARRFEDEKLPPFLSALLGYVARRNTTFACPGHQGSHFLERHPVGRRFVEIVGRNLFALDVPHADPMLGDMTGREGPPAEAEAHAARVFGADRTYFVLNGTLTANKIVATALLAPGDYVLFDRNNHKSIYNGVLAMAGARPVYLETTRNSFGLIGGVPSRCFDESYVRDRLRAIDPERAAAERPFRLAAFQLGTWDGTIYDVHEIVSRIGHLCEYVLFDSAWVGYEQFIPLLERASPLRMELRPGAPGVVVTQSVHKQMSGFSQTSQIHVRDRHLGERTHKHGEAAFDAALKMHGTTSPFYPLFASLDVNARLHGAIGPQMWAEVVETGIEIRKRILQRCRLMRPFVPSTVGERAWQDHDTAQIATDRRFFEFEVGARWHGFDGYDGAVQRLDPCKLLVVTADTHPSAGVERPRLPAGIVAAYLREQGLVPEKSDLYSLVFLLTPATRPEDLERLVDALVRFEAHHCANDPVSLVLPGLHAGDPARYACGLADLCRRIDALYVEEGLAGLLADMFRARFLPRARISVQDAHYRFVRGAYERVPIAEAAGRIAAEGALPYPPGIFCIAPGEVWDGPVHRFFEAIERLLDEAPDFAPFYHGVHTVDDASGRKRLHVHVLSEDA
ncbi:ornithine decarboxylase [Salinarimonas ramus]|uniref:Ornithine decarboxylase SpeF n=1 Tax=Salinarimonas ramus TaxID=690164 RepID=A0A917V538_9HYPH|nr:ornithine decarboxylase [Salinarimonas ramus]GGK38646.1 ornithine decarboxylase SpeF [Salinarimonas ramus]